jgi:hypothetical protein
MNLNTTISFALVGKANKEPQEDYDLVVVVVVVVQQANDKTSQLQLSCVPKHEQLEPSLVGYTPMLHHHQQQAPPQQQQQQNSLFSLPTQIYIYM